MKKEIRYYQSYSDDFVESKNQNCKIPAGYKWLRLDVWSKVMSSLVYGIAVVFGFVYCKFFLHVSYKGKKVLKEAKKTGAFIYCNHTQPVGDVVMPALPCLPGRVYVVVSPANLGIPFIGKTLPYLGALPIPEDTKGMKMFNQAMEYRLSQHRNIVIYPEAHVWEYYTGIRPFPQTSFKYPVKYGKPVYCMTTTYQNRGEGKKPKTTVYIDGPFYAEQSLNPKAQAEQLHSMVYQCMKKRSESSVYEYIQYQERLDN